ncbi:MAG: hypothetical protein LBB55_03850, partial [Zoogloeaceae bacterium]|nr:hypothetical protein [Zoogloeaceae bacterium]
MGKKHVLHPCTKNDVTAALPKTTHVPMRLHDVTPRWGYMILTMFPRRRGLSRLRPFGTPPVRVGASSGRFSSPFDCTPALLEDGTKQSYRFIAIDRAAKREASACSGFPAWNRQKAGVCFLTFL